MKRTFDGLRAILGDGGAAVSADDVAGPQPAPEDRGPSEPEGTPELDLELTTPSLETPEAAREDPEEEDLRIREVPLAVHGEAPESGQTSTVDSGESADPPVDDLGLADLDRGVFDGDNPAGPADIRSARGDAAPIPVSAEPPADRETRVAAPGLLDLDDGVFDGDDRTPRTSEYADPEGLNDLDFSARASAESEAPRRVVDGEPAANRRRIDPGTSQPPLTARLIHPDDGKTPFALEDGPPVRAHGTMAGHVNQLTAALVVILSMFLGASAAIAVFHDRVSQIFMRLG